MASFQLIFQSREQVVVRRGQIRRIGWVIKALEAQVGQFRLGCKRPVSRGIVVQEEEPLGDLPHVQIFRNDGLNPLTSDAQLLRIDLTEIRRSSKIPSYNFGK
jgi:hypothetical protein